MCKEVVNTKTNIIFFDGVCNLCNGFISFLFFLGLPSSMKIASLQGKSAKEHLEEAEYRDLSSVVYLKNGAVYKESTAVIHILMDITWYLKPVGLFLIVPKFLRDPVYKLIAKYRYSLFGKRNTCRLPLENERNYFLD